MLYSDFCGTSSFPRKMVELPPYYYSTNRPPASRIRTYTPTHIYAWTRIGLELRLGYCDYILPYPTVHRRTCFTSFFYFVRSSPSSYRRACLSSYSRLNTTDPNRIQPDLTCFSTRTGSFSCQSERDLLEGGSKLNEECISRWMNGWDVQ